MTGAMRRRMQWIVPIAMVIVAGVATTIRYQGIILPVRIASGSMAEQFLGPHRLVVCEDCEFAFRCGLDAEAPLQLATCPNCGYPGNDLTVATLHDGDRVVVDRWAYVRSGPRRGDVVAFVDPDDETKLAVKRIQGLPNEAVTIRQGELFINDVLHRKSLFEAKQLATLVYDDAFRPTPTTEHQLPARWQSDHDATGWRATPEGYRWASTHPHAASNDWLMYRHWRGYASPHARTVESPVTDNDAYNQGLSRELHEVTDLILSCEVSISREGEVGFLIYDGRERFVARFSAKRRSVDLYRGDNAWQTAVIPNHIDQQCVPIELGVVDNQLFVAIAGKTVIHQAYTPIDRPLQPTSRPLGVAGRRGACSLSNIRVYRDIYYLNPFRGDWAWSGPQPLDEHTYLVLGDNPPLSNDSRHWPQPGLHHKLLIGKVLAPQR